MLQARGCNLTALIGNPNPFGWSLNAGAQPGLMKTLRVLDLGDNWDLTAVDFSIAAETMQLWEL